VPQLADYVRMHVVVLATELLDDPSLVAGWDDELAGLPLELVVYAPEADTDTLVPRLERVLPQRVDAMLLALPERDDVGVAARADAFLGRADRRGALAALPAVESTAELRRLVGAPPVFVHAMWRTGSTYVWKKFRDRPQYRAYIEPLHEQLLQTEDELVRGLTPAATQVLRHPALDTYYCAEFPFENGRVVGFDDRLPYASFRLRETDRHDPLRSYLDGLLRHAERHGQQPVLQFNRSLLRARWLTARFAPLNVLVLRRPLDTWRSFRSFENGYFPAACAMVIGQNATDPLLAGTAARYAIPRIWTGDIARDIAAYGEFANDRGDDLYGAFYELCVLGCVETLGVSHVVLDLDGMSSDARLRAHTEGRLDELGIPLVFDDCSLPRSDGSVAALEDGLLERLAAEAGPTLLLDAELLDSHAPCLTPEWRAIFSRFVS
jgi:hypothetical protein